MQRKQEALHYSDDLQNRFTPKAYLNLFLLHNLFIT